MIRVPECCEVSGAFFWYQAEPPISMPGLLDEYIDMTEFPLPFHLQFELIK